jgi:arylsulfatase A-like enzyme
MLDALRKLGIAQDTIVVFASDNGPQGEVVREFGGDMPDMGSPGPFRGELGDVSEGSIRTAALIRWPGRIGPRSSYAMFSIMDFFPTLAHLAGGKVPDRRRGSARPAARQGRYGAAWRVADLRWPRSRRSAVEAVPHVFCRRGAKPQWLERRTATSRDEQQA